MAGDAMRESPSLQPNVQETRENCLDPQRQHAQLLTVWAQGNKMFRRWQHYRAQGFEQWREFEQWWNLARKITERGLLAQLFPGPSPVILAGGLGKNQDGWVALAAPEAYWPEVFKRLVIIHQGQPAMEWTDHFSVSMECAALFGLRQWNMLARLTELALSEKSTLWTSPHTVLDVLSMLDHELGRLKPLCLEDLEPLSRLWRHRDQAQYLGPWHPSAGRYNWLIRASTSKGPGYVWSTALSSG